MQHLRLQVNQLLRDGVIEPSSSHYSSPMFLVPKQGGDYRAVVDFRLLNKRIAIESVPLPEVHSAFHWFARAKYFTTLDLNQAYHQIPLSEKSKPLTAFCTDWNLFQFTRVPFGLATGAQVLTRLLDRVFQDLKFECVYHYLDDVVVYSEDFESHLKHLRIVLDRLRDAGLTVKPDKVVFATQEISFLGHLVSASGVRIDPERTRAIRDFPSPRDVKGVSRFIGMANFYRQFIPHFADVAAPLNKLRKKGAKFEWGTPQEGAFQFLKEAISKPPVLRMADFSKPFVLQTDASGVALGAVLSQEVNGIRQPVAYASRTLTAQERKASSVYELECLAVVFGIEKFLKYLEHREFILETDNQALSWLLSHPRQLGKIGRWVAKISALKFIVRHIQGAQNTVADALSRMFEVPTDGDSSPVNCNVALTEFPLAFQDLKALQSQDPDLSHTIRRLRDGESVEAYTWYKGALYWRTGRRGARRLVLPVAARDMVFSYFHETSLGGHLGIKKTLAKIYANFWWKGMNHEIRDRVRECHICSMSKPAQNTQLGFLASGVAQRPLQKLFIDYVGKFPRSKTGNSVVLVCVDAFSKFVWLVPLREATTRATIYALRQRIFSTFSVPEVIVSDNAQCFTSREFKRFCFDMGIKHVTTSPYYPQPSHAERFNKNLRAALIAYHSNAHTMWDTQLDWLQLAFNTAQHEATGATPFEVIFPFRAGSPLLNRWHIQDLLPEKSSMASLKRKWDTVRQNLLRNRDTMERRYNLRRRPNPFKSGDLVYYKNHPISHAGKREAAKLMPRYKGPFRIESFLTPVTAKLVDPVDGRFITRTHISMLKPGSHD
jgi:transposase InsO family protein